MFKNVAIVLITRYPKWRRGEQNINNTDKVRGDLALKTIKESLKLGCNVVLADYGSSKSFKKALSKFKSLIKTHRRSSKRSVGRRLAIKKAVKIPGVKAIVLTEAEKVSLITDCLKEIVSPIINGTTDIVIPKRNEKLFKETYPNYMYESEIEGNETFNEELKSHKLINPHESFDMFFGPRVFKNDKKILAIFMKEYIFKVDHLAFPKWYFDAEELSNTNFFPAVAALRKGYKVISVEVPFKYPHIQKLNEEGKNRHFFEDKRKMQRIAITIELLHFVSFLENYKGVRVRLNKS